MHPDITIISDDSPERLIDRIESVLDSSSEFSINNTDKSKAVYGIGVKVEKGKFKRQRLSLIADGEQGHVDVTVMGDNADYHEIKKDVIDAIVALHNGVHNVVCSVRFRSVSKYSLPPKTKKKFKRFVNTANKSALHPNDWEKFYEFVQFCHTYGVKLSEDRLRELLDEEGFSDEQKQRLADTYQHGRGILRDSWFKSSA